METGAIFTLTLPLFLSSPGCQRYWQARRLFARLVEVALLPAVMQLNCFGSRPTRNSNLRQTYLQ